MTTNTGVSHHCGVLHSNDRTVAVIQLGKTAADLMGHSVKTSMASISPGPLAYSRTLKNFFRTGKSTVSRFKSSMYRCSDSWFVFLHVFPSCGECLGHWT